MPDLVALASLWHWDPLRFAVRLPRSSLFYPLGFPVEVYTNSDDVLLAAEESWAGFPKYFAEPPVQLRIAVEEDGTGEAACGLRMAGQHHLVAMISDPRNFAICDLPNHFACGFFTQASVRNRAWFRYFYLDTIVQLCLWRTHLTRIHAGCVARDRRGFLLCGASGEGKSCLTYACARRGWTLISDEAPSLVRGCRERTVIGKPHTIHLRESAFELFPELCGRTASPDPVGKISFEVRTAELPNVRTACRAEIAAVIFLERRAGARAAIRPMAKEEAWRRLAADLPYFGEPAHEEHLATLRNLLGAECCRLEYSDLEPAIDLLEGVSGNGEES